MGTKNCMTYSKRYYSCFTRSSCAVVVGTNSIIQAYSAVRQYQKKGQWYFSVHMLSGNIVRDWVENLQLFWPGLQVWRWYVGSVGTYQVYFQVMLGDIDEAAENLNAFHQLWKQYGFPPEAYRYGYSTNSTQLIANTHWIYLVSALVFPYQT